MFICKACAKERDQFIIPFSYGPCEVCDKTGPCDDVKHIRPLKEKEPSGVKTKDGRLLQNEFGEYL